MLCGVAHAQDTGALQAKWKHALTLYEAGQRDEALREAREAQQMAAHLFGEDSEQALLLLMTIGRVESAMQKYDNARQDLQRAYEASRKRYGESAHRTVIGEILLGDNEFHAGRADAAEPLLSHAMAQPVANDEMRMLNLLDLVTIYAKEENGVKLKPLLVELERLMEPRYGSLQPALKIEVLASFGAAYNKLGDYARAESFLRRAWNESAAGVPGATRATAANNLADLYTNLSDYADAADYLRQARQLETGLAPDDPVCIATLGFETALAWYQGDRSPPGAQRTAFLQQARNDASQAVQLCARRFGENSEAEVEALLQLAAVQVEVADFTGAHATFDRIAQIAASRKLSVGEQCNLDIQLGWYYLHQGEARKSLDCTRRATDFAVSHYGPTSPNAAILVLNQAAALCDLGDRAAAQRFVEQAQTSQKQSIAEVFSFTSEQQRLDYLASMRKFAYVGFLTLNLDKHLADALLEFKGLVLDSMIEDQQLAQQMLAQGDVELRSAMQRLQQAKVDRENAERQHDETRVTAANTAINEAEQFIARHVHAGSNSRAALNVTSEQVAACLPPHSVLVEYLHYDRYESKGNYTHGYGAVVLTPEGHCQWVDCGAEDAVRLSIGRYRHIVRGQARDSETASVLQALEAAIWAPVEKAFPPGTTAVIISPDEQLCFVSYATLLYPDRKFVCEKYRLYYVSSGRDLLSRVPLTKSHEVALFGNPDYAWDTSGRLAATPDMVVAMRGGTLRDLASMQLAALPGTATECEKIATQLRSPQRPVEVFLGRDATEEKVRAVAQRAPHILHLATHGFFVPEPVASGANTVAHTPTDAMDRSGLALAGAQNTLSHWQRHEVPPAGSDGILTAAEVSLLPLRGTWLVTLSACDTGVGEAASGEGVIGLRRGFVEAGVRHLLMTLWPVADAETARFMSEFYGLAEKINSPADALCEVQRQWLVRMRDTTGLSDAVQIAGPFLISSQGPLGQ
jgi:CHAT domain-containing protein